MSIFQSLTVPCPACGKPVTFKVVNSVNATRRPDLRDAILDGSFQVEACTACREEFRADPALNYLDVSRGQWLSAHPVSELATWARLEDADRATFERAYGQAAPATAREVGAGLVPRTVFGWPALREKIVANEAGVDDLALEVLKVAVLRDSEASPVGSAELRLVHVEEGVLRLVWVDPLTGDAQESFNVPREALDELAGDADWDAVRADIGGGMFVDMQRLILAG